ncbi:MAG: phosphatidate cytidylyltransferase [bacterium]|nr:phosphatidate cytidylyltransferase [Gammaproteobacteria bacterium]HIL98545.1 phosphatidate cytidylyltransferase [Pseudomonadales bacterium]
MLKQRIVTALILIPIAIGGVFFLPTQAFTVFIGAVLTIAAWEWANFAGFEGSNRYLYALFIALLMGASSFVSAELLLIPGVIWWLVAFVLVVNYPQMSNWWSSKAAISLMGVFCLVPGHVAMVTLKQTTDSSFLILLLFFLIWGADIGAYFSGKAFGSKKLAPKVSPGKSWEGFCGGLLFATLIAVAMLMWLGRPDLQSIGGVIFLVGCVVIIMVSVLGDLVESMLKRNRGIKDSSGLLPGHGGVLDRLDSLLSAGPVFALFIVVFGWS